MPLPEWPLLEGMLVDTVTDAIAFISRALRCPVFRSHRHHLECWLVIQDALTIADLCGLQYQEPTVGVRIIWNIYVPRV